MGERRKTVGRGRYTTRYSVAACSHGQNCVLCRPESVCWIYVHIYPLSMLHQEKQSNTWDGVRDWYMDCTDNVNTWDSESSHVQQNVAQPKMYESLLSGIFHVILSDCNWLCVTKSMQRKSQLKGTTVCTHAVWEEGSQLAGLKGMNMKQNG